MYFWGTKTHKYFETELCKVTFKHNHILITSLLKSELSIKEAVWLEWRQHSPMPQSQHW